MNAPPFPTNPSVGESFGNWTWNGVRWVCSATTGIAVNTVVLTVSGPYMPSPGLVSCVVETVGGGGGGGPAAADLTSTSSSGWMMGGGGGSSGGYSRKTLPAALVAGGVNVTIGAAGAGGTAGVAGSPGGATTFGALCTANGGLGGGSGNPGDQYGDGGPRTQPGLGDIASPGNAGGTGVAHYYDTSAIAGAAIGGQGGGGFFDGADRNVSAVAGVSFDGLPGWQGAGGGGGVSGLSTLPAAGGAGGSGLCVVTEYLWADADTGGDCLNPPVNVNARVAVTQVPWPGPGPCPPGWGGQIGWDGEG